MAKLLTGHIVDPGKVGIQLGLLAWSHHKKVIFANGCFDILHAGHVALLKQAKKLGGYLIVALNTDESIRQIKANSRILRPVQTLDHRMSVISELRCVDFVTWFDETTPLGLIARIKPHYIVKGDDYVASDVVGFNEAKSWGGEVVIIPRIGGLSTTGILKGASCVESQAKACSL